MSSSAPPAAGSPRDEHPAERSGADSPAPPAPSIGRLTARIAELGLADRRRLDGRLGAARKQRDPARRDRALHEVDRQVAAAERRLFRRAASVPDITFPEELPVSAAVPELARVIAENQVVIVAGETGSGKSTQLPKLCLQMGRGVRGLIGHTQPRRIAARALAERISEETGTQLGQAIGYTVRFGDHTGPDTLVKLMTDGILLAEIGRDRLLSAYDTIIIDEAHERSLTIDFLLGYLVGLLPRRPDLKVIITSATIDPQRFSRHFGDAPIVEVSGRTYPVEIRYRPYGLAAEDVDSDDEQEPDEDEDAPPSRRPSGRPIAERTDDRDQGQAIVDAVDELCAAGPGDILVFLSGEREITDTAEVLRGHLAGRSGPAVQDGQRSEAARASAASRVEVLPLYGRLSAADQHKVFDRHTGRRIVLSTNVAETSLTVPGIRYVIDPGTARISRYSPRTKVQRLPIEPISQASAGQRAGRCGRLENGICIRLYSESDFESRPRFTDPEILRTSLASVILQMAALQLGDIETFPFLEPPDRRQVTDGLTVLDELGALAPSAERSGGPRLTPVGRSMAALPVDPRLARMIVEGHERQCLREMLVIAAALSVVDVREYPLDDRDRAKAAHSRFVDANSDFNALLNLWRYLAEQAKTRSGNGFRRMCREEYLHYLRIREWQDLHAQLAHLCRGLKMDPEVESPPLPVSRERAGGREPKKDQPATQGGRGSLATDIDTERVHTALLAGLLSHLGQKSETSREYQGTRGTSWVIWPGSALAKKGARLVVAAELVETSRLWGRLCASVDPVWVERVGGDLLRRSYSEPRWDARRASVVANEKVTLLGVTLIGARTVQFDRIDPEVSRDLFIRHALVERDWQTRHAFFAANQQALDEIARWEDRTRRRDIVVDDETLFALYDARVPADVTSGRHFDSWWKKASRRDPGLLTFTPEMLIAAGAERFDAAAYPDRYTSGELDLPVDYVYDPSRSDDGVTVSIPLAVLARVDPAAFDDQIPGLRSDLAVALLRSLPKTLRRNFVPAADFAAVALRRMQAAEASGPAAGGFPARFAAALSGATGIAVRATDFDLTKVPDHLKLTFAVTDDDGKRVAAGKDLAALQHRLRPAADAAVADAVGRDLERSGLTAFPEPGLPRTVTTVVAGQPVTAYPALVTEEPADAVTVGIRILAGEPEQARAMWAATRRLLARAAPMSAKQIRAALTREQVLILAAPPEGTFADLLRDAIDAAVDALLDWAGGPVWTVAEFSRLQSRIAPHVQRAVLDVLRTATSVLTDARDAAGAIDELTGGRDLRREDPLFASVRDLRARLRATVGPGFLLRAGAAGLPDVGRDVRAIAIRARRVRENPDRDRRLMTEVAALETESDGVISALPPERSAEPDVLALRRLLAEYRIAVFAQPMKTVVPVSEKRIRNAVAALRR